MRAFPIDEQYGLTMIVNSDRRICRVEYCLSKANTGNWHGLVDDTAGCRIGIYQTAADD